MVVMFFDILPCLFCNTNLCDFDMSNTEHHILLSFGCEDQAEKFKKILSTCYLSSTVVQVQVLCIFTHQVLTNVYLSTSTGT